MICRFLILIIILATSCSLNTERNFKKLNDGVYLQLLGFTSGNKALTPGDYILADMKFLTQEDSVFFEGKRKFRIDHPETGGAVHYAFIELMEGDTASVIVPVDDFFHRTMKRDVPSFLKNDNLFTINIRIVDLQTRSEFEKEKQLFLNWVSEFRHSEEDQIKKYMLENELPFEEGNEGIYYISLQPGNGKKPKKGKNITIHYEGRFLNGKFIESTKKRSQPLDFIFGSEMIVIKGIEIAVEKMTEGEKALVIIPSDLAFGAGGAGKGIIPPYTSLIYELELLKVE